MRTRNKLAVLAATALLTAMPAVASATGTHHGKPTSPVNQGTAHQPSDPGSQGAAAPGPSASLAAKAKAYGRYCQGESKKHVAGQKGTPFSQCVTAMAKLATGKTTNPARACAKLSKKHVAGHKGTPYSTCVVAAAKLRGGQ